MPPGNSRLSRALSTRARRWVAAVIALIVVIGIAVIAWPSSEPESVAEQDLTIPVAADPADPGKRTIDLDATLYLPASTPAPAVIVAHGFGGSKLSVTSDAQDLARAGFVVLAYSARGFGASGGQISLNSLDFEVPDARALVDWLAERPEVQLDAPGDPRVGSTGGSYGGALSLMLAGTDPRIDAIVPLITWNDLAQSLFPNYLQPADAEVAATPADVPGAPDGVFKKYWAAALITSVVAGASLDPTSAVDTGEGGRTNGLSSGSRNDDEPSAGVPALGGDGGTAGNGAGDGADPGCGRLRLDICAAYARAAQTGRLSPALEELLARSNPAAVAGSITAPTLLVQGEQDTLFGLDQADANARAIAGNGATVAVAWYRGGHDGGSPDPTTRARITGWLTHYLLGTGPVPTTDFRYAVDGPISDNGRARSRTLQAGPYPGLPGNPDTPRRDIALSGADQIVINPPGGSPAAITSLPGLSSVLSTAVSSLASGLPGQTARFTSAPMEQLTVVTGTPRIELQVARVASASAEESTDNDPVLFASMAKVNDAGIRTLAGNAVAPIRLPDLPADGSPATFTVDLPPAAFQVESGSSLQISVSTTDQAFSGSTTPAVYRISAGSAPVVSVPEVGGVRVSAGEVPIAQLIGLIVLAVAGIAGLVIAGRVRHRTRDVDPDLVDVPLRISGLQKAYPGGVKAVTDVSFDVLPGQVLGLLGPNGAGKTTTLRMVMGLIRPTAGEIRVFGQRIRPGAEVLSRIGSFVEGSGFLPHLSGRSNLDLYWKATGRPAEDAHMDVALEIAGLGKAIDRRVKTYSQGMRQRLAIAQAMLGLPDLLLLDEPTNGLDPPQIHAMREVLRRYATTGRTVLVSSHLLSEVEQTCTHVVVVHLGRTIAQGTVADMVAASGDMVFTVEESAAERAAAVLRGLPGVGEVDVVDGAVQADLDEVAPALAIRSLVEAGIDVRSAAPRNRLEDVFLELVGSASKGGT